MTAGYSGTPVPKKLGIKAGARVLLDGAPAGLPLVAPLETAGRLWICWPKRSSGVPTDLTENVLRDYGLAQGLVDVQVCAVDEPWVRAGVRPHAEGPVVSRRARPRPAPPRGRR